MLLQLLLLVGYLGSIAIRTLVRGRDVSPSRPCRAAPRWPSAWPAPSSWREPPTGFPPRSAWPRCWSAPHATSSAVMVVGRREGSALNFYFYTTLALVLVLAGFAIAVDGPWPGAVFALLAVAGHRTVVSSWRASSCCCTVRSTSSPLASSPAR